MKRTKLLALLGAAVLTVGTVSIAFANTLSEDKPNQAGSTINELIGAGTSVDCSDFVDGFAVGEGQVGIHFILTSPEAETGNITGSVDGTAFGPVAGIFHGNSENGAMHFYVVVDGDGDSVVNDAETDVDGNNLTISHLCLGAEETEPPSTDTPTDEPSFESTEEGNTDAPSEPNTATIGGNGTSGPADGAWLLVVALGVLLASVVVMTPARAKSQR